MINPIPDTNYFELLMKYMTHVVANEGVAFIPALPDDEFSPSEITELHRIREYVRNQNLFLSEGPV